MATVASRLLRAARKASLESRTAAAAASRSAVMASRKARAAAVAATVAHATLLGSCCKSCPIRGNKNTRPLVYHSPDYEHVPDDAKTPTNKDFESDEAVWALYERWCKGFDKERDHAEMARRFKLFKHRAKWVHYSNTYLPLDPEEAAIYIQKRREVKLLLSKGEDVTNFDECHVPMELGQFADGGDPFMWEDQKELLKELEDGYDPFSAEDVTRE